MSSVSKQITGKAGETRKKCSLTHKKLESPDDVPENKKKDTQKYVWFCYSDKVI